MADAKDDTDKPKIVAAALKFFKAEVESQKSQRQREKEDLELQVPEFQWDPDVRQQRAGQIIDGVPIPARPMLSVSKIDAPAQLIMNQQRKAHLAPQISPISEDADDETAEIIADIYRGIARESRASLARDWGFDRSTKCGLGGYRAITAYDDHGGHPFDQKILIKRILNWGAVYLDSSAQEPDWSDGQEALIVDDLPWERYKREYPKSKLAKKDDAELNDLADELLVELGNEVPKWVTTESGKRAVRVAERYWIEYKDRTYVTLDDGETAVFDDEIPAGRKALEGPGAKTRPYREPTVHWAKINAIEVLEETTLPGEHIPIFPSVGRELQMFDGERRWVGVYRPARDAQKGFNYSLSGAVEKGALAPMSPWIGAEGFMEGHEARWNQSNVRRFPALEYKPSSLQGTLNPPPQRNVASVDISTDLILLQQFNDAIQATTFTPDPALGQVNQKDRSGKAIQALQGQSEAGTSNYIQNFSEITLPLEAKVILSWIPKYYDRPGRLVRTIKANNDEATVMINQPFVVDPQNKRPIAAPNGIAPPQHQNAKVKHYDLKKGVYGVAVTVGKDYQTSRMQASDALATLFQHVPAVFPILGPTWLQHQDWPGHQEAADLLKKMQPPQLQETPDGEPSADQLKQQLTAMQQAMQQMQQQLGQATKAVETDQAKQQAQIQTAQMKEATTVEVAKMDNAAKLDIERLKLEGERIKASASITIERLKQQHALALAGHEAELASETAAAEGLDAERGRAHEMTEAERARQHESGMAERAGLRDFAEAEQGRGHEAEMAEAAGQREAQMAAEQAARDAEQPPA